MRNGRATAAIVALGVLASACTRNEIAPGVTAVSATDPVAPGAVRFAMDNPDPEKWVPRIRQGAPDGSVRYGFTCKVLACPEPATVVVTNRRAPSGRPDQKSLEKLAKEIIPKLAQARNLELQVSTDNKGKIETLSSAVTSYNEYPAILTETKLSVGPTSRHITTATVFAGRLLITINVEAGDRATAKTAADAFARAFKVQEGKLEGTTALEGQ
jgi:hypothetical protein